VGAADAGIELEGDAHRLEAAAEVPGQLVAVEAVARAGKSGAEAAIFAFEGVDDAGEARFREQSGVEPALRGAAGVHALDHRAVLCGHQPRGLGGGDAEDVHGLLGGKAKGGGSAGGSGKNADRGARVPALANMLRAHAEADTWADLVARDGGGEEVPAGDGGPQLGDREHGRKRHGAHVQHTSAMDVVELEALHERAVGERCVRGRKAPAGAPDGAGGR
jgi:hypothetical protein